MQRLFCSNDLFSDSKIKLWKPVKQVMKLNPNRSLFLLWGKKLNTISSAISLNLQLYYFNAISIFYMNNSHGVRFSNPKSFGLPEKKSVATNLMNWPLFILILLNFIWSSYPLCLYREMWYVWVREVNKIINTSNTLPKLEQLILPFLPFPSVLW